MTDSRRVLIAGAGPVGLSAALALARRGVPVAVFERRAALSQASLASTFHASTLEILARLGVVEGALAEGRRVDWIGYFDVPAPGTAPSLFARFDLGLLADQTRFPFRLHFEQSRLTPLMVERLATYHATPVRFGAEVTGVSADDDGVTISLADGTRERGAYLVAADGAHSIVRQTQGIAFTGAPYPSRVLRVVTAVDLRTVVPGLASVSYLFAGARSCSLLEMPDCWRVIIRLPPDESDARAQEPARVQERVAAFLPTGGALAVRSTDVYGASRMIADRYRAGRVLLAGDAAHLTNTRGGMNMNCGIQDAYALADALATVLGGGSDAALDDYAATRRWVAAEAVIPRSDLTVTGGTDWLATIRETARDPARARAYLSGAAMLDIMPPLS